MKKIAILMITLVAAVSIDLTTRAEDIERPKIYIRALIAAKDSGIPQSYSNIISQFFENSMIKMIKSKFDVMSHSTAKAMMSEKEELDALTCNDDSCMQTVIKAIQSEYLVYGEIQTMEKTKYIISVKLMHRMPGGLAVIEGSSIQQIDKIEFNEVTKAAERAVGELLGVTEEKKSEDKDSKISDAQDSTKIIEPDKKTDYIDNQPVLDEFAGKASAQTVQGNRIAGTFTSPMKSIQWYKMTPEKASNKTFSLNHGQGIDFDFAVYDDNKLLQTAESTTTPDNINITKMMGTCYVKVWNYKGSGSYSIDITGYTDPKAFATKVSGMVISGSFTSTARAEHWYKLNGQEGTSPAFTIQHDAMADFDFAVYRDDMLISSAQGTNPSESLNCQLQGGGPTYVKVWNFKGMGLYTISINKDGQGMKDQSVGFGKSGTMATNYSKETAKLVNSLSIQGYFPTSAQSDQWFRLSGKEGTNPSFTIQHDQQSDFDFEVYSNENLACKAQGSYSGDTVKCHVPGTCYIKVWNFKGNGNFTIQVQP